METETPNLLEMGCALCAMKGKPTVGEISIAPHSETLTIHHLCNANYHSFMEIIKHHVEQETNYTFPLRTLNVINFSVNFRELRDPNNVPITAPGYFSKISVIYVRTSLTQFSFFMGRLKFERTSLWKYYKDTEKLCFTSVDNPRDVFWDGWYKSWKVQILEIETLYVNKSVPPLTLCQGMRSIHTLILSDVVMHSGVLFGGDIHTSFRNMLLLFAPQLECLVINCSTSMFLRMVYSAMGIVGAGGTVWPRLKELHVLRNERKEDDFVVTFTPSAKQIYLQQVPNLHVVRVGNQESHLRNIQLAPEMVLREQLLPNTHKHTARVRHRTHFAAHVFTYFMEKLGPGKDLPRLLTRQYLAYFNYAEEPPAEFLYEENCHAITSIDFDHLKNMYERCDGVNQMGKGADRSDVYQRQAESARNKLVVARQKLAAAKQAFDDKIVGKRKRLHNALEKCRAEVQKLEAEVEHAEVSETRLKEMHVYSKEAGKAYAERYVRQMLKLPSETRLVVPEKWVQ